MYISGVSIKTIFVYRIIDGVSIPIVENAIYISVVKTVAPIIFTGGSSIEEALNIAPFCVGSICWD